MAETKLSEPARKILKYFVRNPGAADTYDGIVRWRLLEEAIHQTTEETQEALAWLVAHDFLREVPVAGSVPIFRLNSEKQGEAAVLLGQSPLRAEGA